LALSVAGASPSRAASLQVTPVSIEVGAPGAAATLTLRNESPTPLNAQIRVFRWTQEGGQEKLTPTDAVVASPPIAQMTSAANYTVRLVRLSKEPIVGEESYRLLIDELPAPRTRERRSVALNIRYSIPVFFYARDSARAKLDWSIEERGGRAYVKATNSGDRHARISALTIRNPAGASLSFGKGLTGYALGGSAMGWAIPGGKGRANAYRSAVVAAQTDIGPIVASAHAQPGQ
jgi:fimbrial chaperone protein